MSVILKAENISKQYRLGTVGTGSLQHDLNRWWHSLRGKEDPYLKVGGINDRSAKATEDYVWALRDINFEVKQGEVLGIIGKNGAGKSTLLKILSRVTAPTTGSIKTKGRIASLLEVGTGFHGELTGRENIFMNGAVLGMSRAEIKAKLDEIIDFSGCEKYIDTPVKRYSSGMTVRLGFAVAAHLEPEILVVDEVLAVGDAEFQKKAIGKMQDLSTGEGRTVLFVSHNMASVKSLCDRGILLQNGELSSEGRIYEIVNKYLDTSKSIPRNEAIISDKNRKFKTSREIELVRISVESKKISVRSKMNFNLQIKKNKDFSPTISITGTICNNNNVAIGSFFSESFLVTKDHSSIALTIENHNLSVGEYYLNLALSIGDIKSSEIKTIDHAYEVIGFEIFEEKIEDNQVIRWNQDWGALFFQSYIKVD